MTNEEALAKAEEHEKWAALFKAKSEGKKIQYFNCTGNWCDPSEGADWSFDNQVDHYRIKPEPKKSLGYRRYLIKLDSTGASLRVCCWQEDYYVPFSSCEKEPGFLRWIDNEIQYEEYEEK